TGFPPVLPSSAKTKETVQTVPSLLIGLPFDSMGESPRPQLDRPVRNNAWFKKTCQTVFRKGSGRLCLSGQRRNGRRRRRGRRSSSSGRVGVPVRGSGDACRRRHWRYLGVVNDVVIQAIERQLQPVRHSKFVVDFPQIVLYHLFGRAHA